MSAVIADPAAGAAPAGRGKKKLLVVGAAILVLALLVGASAVFFLKQRAARAAASAGDEDIALADSPASRSDSKSAPVYLPLDPFVVNLADRDVDRFAQIGITFELDNGTAGEQLKAYMPSVRNAILMVLANKTSRELLDRAGKEQLAQEIMREAVRPMGIEAAVPEPVSTLPAIKAASAAAPSGPAAAVDAAAAASSAASPLPLPRSGARPAPPLPASTTSPPSPGRSRNLAASRSATRSSTFTSPASSSNERADPHAGRVDALLQGIAGESDSLAPEAAGADGVRSYDLVNQDRIVRGACRRSRSSTSASPEHPRRLFNFIRKSPESRSGDARAEVQRLPARDRRCRPTSTSSRAAAARRGLVVFEPSLVFAVVDALFGGNGKLHTRIEGRDFSPTEQRIIQRLVEVVTAEYQRAWSGIYPLVLEYQRSEMQPQFASIATPSEVVVSTSFASRSARPAAASTSASRIRRSSRSRRPLLDDAGRRQRARPALGQPDDRADPGSRGRARRRAGACAGHGRADALLQARRLHRARPAPRHPGQGRRGAGVRLSLRHVQRQVRAEGGPAAEELPQRLARDSMQTENPPATTPRPATGAPRRRPKSRASCAARRPGLAGAVHELHAPARRRRRATTST
jgi:flagellar basal body-associated protein FliL